MIDRKTLEETHKLVTDSTTVSMLRAASRVTTICDSLEECLAALKACRACLDEPMDQSPNSNDCMWCGPRYGSPHRGNCSGRIALALTDPILEAMK